MIFVSISRVKPSLEPKYYRRRRITAVVIALILVALAVGIGGVVQGKTGWSPFKNDEQNSAQDSEDDNEPVNTSPVAVKPEEDPDPRPKPKAELRRVAKFSPIPNPPKPGETKEIIVRSDGMVRKYVLNVPKEASWLNSSGKPLPLIMGYHGYREAAEHMDRYAGLSNRGAIAVYPAGMGRAWEGAPYAVTKDGQDLRFTKKILDEVSSTYRVDKRRVYATGMSNGGGFAAKLACEMPEEFSAIAAVAGAYYPGTWKGCANKESDPEKPRSVRFDKGRTVPFLEMHGRKDQLIQYKGGNLHHTPYLGAVRLASLYASRAQCFGAPQTTDITSTVLRIKWPGCPKNAEVIHVAVKDAGHTWPGELTGLAGAAAAKGTLGDREKKERTSKSLFAASEIEQFFDRHVR